MKWVVIALLAVLAGACIFGLGLIGYFAWGEQTSWYMPLNIAAAVFVGLYALYEMIVREREWERA